MDIFDFLWTFYLNHLSPLWGYFLTPMGILLSKEFYQGNIGAQSDLTQVMTLKKKNLKLSLWADTEKDRTVVNCELWKVTDSFTEQCM